MMMMVGLEMGQVLGQASLSRCVALRCGVVWCAVFG